MTRNDQEILRASAASVQEPAVLRRLAVQWVCALTVIVLLFGPHLAHALDGERVVWFLWQPGEWLVLAGVLCMVAFLAVAARHGIKLLRVRWLIRLFDHAFVIAFGAGVLNNLWFHTIRPQGYRIAQHGMEIQTAWLVMFLIVGYSLASGATQLVLRTRQLCQILSPLVAITICQLAALPTLAESREALVKPQTAKMMPVRNQAAAHPVYLILFDEWSYPRTYRDGKVRPEFRHLASLAGQATTYHAAHAPGIETPKSVPSILRNTSDMPEARGAVAGFVSNGQWQPAKEYPSIFARAGCQDYQKVFVHWGYALNLWLDGELDATRAYSMYARPDGPVNQALDHLHQGLQYWTDPWSNFVSAKLWKQGRNDRHTMSMYEHMRHDLLTILRDLPDHTFGIVHYPLPHYPSIMNPDGTYRGEAAKGWSNEDVEGYENNLACMDQVVGEIVSTLKAAGRFEKSMLILTSDHSWRKDPDVPNKTNALLTHVPLIVKFPNQAQPATVDRDFKICRLGELIETALKQGAEPF